MPELTHDTAEDGFHEIQLSGKQLIFLFMTGTVVLVFTFLCGVLVGKSVPGAREGLVEGQAARSGGSATPTAADAGPPAAEPPAPPAEDELSYHKRLQSSGPVDEPKQKPQPPAAEVPAPAAVPKPAPAQASGPEVPTSGRPGTWFVQVHALQNRATAAGIIKNLLAKGYPAYLENPAPGAPAIYRVRIGRYSDRREADQVARRLQKEEQFNPEVRR